jgi:hypothetical protein
MVQLDIKPIHHEGLNCFEDSLISVASWLDRDYELAFSHTWGFELVPEDPGCKGLIGNRITPGCKFLSELIKKYCGISLIFHEVENHTEVLSIIRRELSNSLPIIFCLDTFWCPWISQYQKLHLSHYCLAIGLDDDSTILCIDPSISPAVLQLPCNCFINGCNRGRTAIFLVDEYCPITDYWDVIGGSLNNFLNNNCFRNMMAFKEIFSSCFDFDLEFKNFDINIWIVLIHRNITLISGGRGLYSKFLGYIANKTNNTGLLAYKDNFIKAASNWKTIIGALTKAYKTKQFEPTKIRVAELLQKAAQFEQDTANSLSDFIKNPNEIYDASDNKILQLPKEFLTGTLIFLNLEDYFNNNGIGNINSGKCTADLSGGGSFIGFEGFPSGDILSLNNFSFKLPQILDGKKDNISCDQQELQVPSYFCRSIQVFGTAENGSFYENMNVVYKDGSIDTIAMGLSNLERSSPLYGEIPMWQGLFAGCKVKITLYAKEYEIRSDKSIDKIILPYCPNMHIFALTLRVLE